MAARVRHDYNRRAMSRACFAADPIALGRTAVAWLTAGVLAMAPLPAAAAGPSPLPVAPGAAPAPVDAEPSAPGGGGEPADGDPQDGEPGEVKAEDVRTDAAETEAVKTEDVKAEVAKSEVAESEVADTEAVQTEAVQTEAAETEDAADREPDGDDDDTALPPLTTLQRAGWWTMFGAFAIGSTAGVFAGLAERQEDRATRLANRFDLEIGAQVQYAEVADEYEGYLDRGRAFQRTAIALAAVTGLATAAGITFFALDAARRKRPRTEQQQRRARRGPRFRMLGSTVEAKF